MLACIPSGLAYPHIQLDRNRKKKLFVDRRTQTDICTYVRTTDGWSDRPEFQFSRSSLGNDLKTKDRFSRFLRHPACKQRGPILILALHNLSFTYLLRHSTTYLQPQDPHRASLMAKEFSWSYRQKYSDPFLTYNSQWLILVSPCIRNCIYSLVTSNILMYMYL